MKSQNPIFSSCLLSILAIGVVPWLVGSDSEMAAQGRESKGTIFLPGASTIGPFRKVVLFGFDDWAFPFRSHVETRLFLPDHPQVVLRGGPPGSYDEDPMYYGTIIRIGNTLHLWYAGNHGNLTDTAGFEREDNVLCYATSKDGVHWEKPDLGLVAFKGSKHNNICDFPDAAVWDHTCAMIYEPEDPDPNRRFKMAYEGGVGDDDEHHGTNLFCVAFSPDGLHWHPSPLNPIGGGLVLEMSGITKWGGLYYVTGQSGAVFHHSPGRRLGSFVSADFEHWSPCPALGLDRSPDVTGPSMDDQENSFEEIHLGAGLWNRGNVVLGIYGQWHGVPSGDRRFLTMDLGFAISHDAIHYVEPIRNFRLVPAREQPDGPLGVGPALLQGQGMENLGDKTLYWYSLFRGNAGSAIRLVTWPRDRLGALQPFTPKKVRTISCPIEALDDQAKVFINASGLGPNCALRISLVDEGFRPMAGFSEEDCAKLAEDGFRRPISWKGGRTLPKNQRVRLDISFNGIRPEDAKLYAVYISP